MVLTLFKNQFQPHQNALKSVGGWGSAPDPQIVRESLFDACQSDTPRGAPIPIFAPGARYPRYATEYTRLCDMHMNRCVINVMYYYYYYYCTLILITEGLNLNTWYQKLFRFKLSEIKQPLKHSQSFIC